MNKNIAKDMLNGAYQLLEGKQLNQLIKVNVPHKIMYDGTKIVGPSEIPVVTSQIADSFFKKYVEVWKQIKNENWADDDAKELIDYDSECWNNIAD